MHWDRSIDLQSKQDFSVNAGFDAENQMEDVDSSESSDTTDEEQVNIVMYYTNYIVSNYLCGLQAGDIDELLSPGYPVFFNYANILPTKAPPSLKVYMWPTRGLVLIHRVTFSVSRKEL